MEALRWAIRKRDHRTLFDTLLYTGMRYVEANRLHKHPEWFLDERRSIHLPKEASRKKKRTVSERYVYLSARGMSIITHFFTMEREIPGTHTWTENMKRWGEEAVSGTEGLSAKSTRKTWESWLYVRGYPEAAIYLSQGHDPRTALKHYLNLPFSPSEKEEIRQYTMGWAGLQPNTPK